MTVTATATTKLSDPTSLKTRVSLLSKHSRSVKKRQVSFALWGIIQWVLVAEFVGVTVNRERKTMDRVTIITK